MIKWLFPKVPSIQRFLMLVWLPWILLCLLVLLCHRRIWRKLLQSSPHVIQHAQKDLRLLPEFVQLVFENRFIISINFIVIFFIFKGGGVTVILMIAIHITCIDLILCDK